MGILPGEIGRQHGITAGQSSPSFGKRSFSADLEMNLPFVRIYCLAADFAVRRLLRSYPPGEGPVASGMVLILAAPACGLLGLALAEQWAGWAEMARVGTWHLSNRALRLPVAQHRIDAFASAAALFLGIAVMRYRTGRRTPAAG